VDENGCSASDDITVVVIKDRPVYIPSAFSPNDDGINDVFTVYGGKSVTEIKSFLVFNRWGESVHEYFGFSPNDPAAGWDGTHRGEKMQPAVFTWYAEVAFIDGRIELYKGDVTLYR
jgi:gliding motility-associated-like protein